MANWNVGEVITFTLEGIDENSVKQIPLWEVKEQGFEGNIQSVRLVKKGSKGIFGIGVEPNQYEILVRLDASLSEPKAKQLYVVFGSTRPMSEDDMRDCVNYGRDQLTKDSSEFNDRMLEYQKLQIPTTARSIVLAGDMSSDTIDLYEQCARELRRDQPLHNFGFNINHFYNAAKTPSLDLKWIVVFHFE